jgi:triosephosphate isomerase
MRRSLVVGNWKMHGSADTVDELLTELKRQLDCVDSNKVAVAVCPPYVFIPQAVSALKSSVIDVGAQNVSDQQQGAFTGEISASMLAELGSQFAIVGHSERRTLFAECNEVIAAKFIASQSAGLIPILCVGESLEQREAGDTLVCIEQQLKVVIEIAGINSFTNAVVAYEPIWAIGTGKTASPEQAQTVHAHIRKLIADFDQAVADNVQIVYGGSVKADNAKQLFANNDIDGALVGGASLKAADFSEICKAAE